MEEPVGESPVVFLRVKNLPEIADKRMSKTESACFICGIPFSKKGVSQTAKHVCRFCYHGVCAACSPFTALHPESNQSERICLNCYTRFLKESVNEENEAKNQEKLQHEIESFKRESVEIHNKELERLREESRSLERNFKDQINRLSREVEERETRIMSMNFETKPAEEHKKDESVAEFIKKMHELELENQSLKSKIAATTYQAQPKDSCLKCTIQ